MTQLSERDLRIEAAGPALEGRLHQGTGTPGAVVLHPHPQYGGDMHNHVVGAICEALAARGFQVIQVAGVESTPATGVARRETFTDHASLDNALRRLVRDTDCVAVVHTAAVSDFAVVGAQTDTKIPSGSELSVKLQPTHKIIERIIGAGQERGELRADISATLVSFVFWGAVDEVLTGLRA